MKYKVLVILGFVIVYLFSFEFIYFSKEIKFFMQCFGAVIVGLAIGLSEKNKD